VGIVRAGVGFDNIDLLGARAAGITVCNVPDYGTDEVADHAMALLLWCLR
jgi:D-3-phosphoglycerate dehydrogenase/C-terminal binding protein